jgi:DeoR/GlpR family transcriptional regulator of sugar metabolism
MNERSLKIIQMLNEAGTLDVSTLAQELNVSGVTIRKDLAALEERGLLRREHGYAVAVSPDDLSYRMTLNYEVKKRIALRASEMVENGETIMIESGSTCAMLASELAENRQDITIITNSAFIADHIRCFRGVRVILLGGSYDPDSQVMTGPLVQMCVSKFFVDKFFIGTDGFYPPQGFSNVSLSRAESVRAMAESAKRLIILTDSSKFNKRGVVTLLHAREVDTVVTDDVPEVCRASLEENGVEIVIA